MKIERPAFRRIRAVLLVVCMASISYFVYRVRLGNEMTDLSQRLQITESPTSGEHVVAFYRRVLERRVEDKRALESLTAELQAAGFARVDYETTKPGVVPKVEVWLKPLPSFPFAHQNDLHVYVRYNDNGEIEGFTIDNS